MRIIDKKTAILEEGEPMPCPCMHCENIYAVPLHSEKSVCPQCHRINDHNKTDGFVIKGERFRD